MPMIETALTRLLDILLSDPARPDGIGSWAASSPPPSPTLAPSA